MVNIFKNATFLKACLGALLLTISGCTERDLCEIPQTKKKHPWHAGSERPYVIRGVKYYPQMHYQYCAVGLASWYGNESLGPTATGRMFNPQKPTAAHRILPLPCVVEVENLENHKRITLLVNDRGPFAQTDKRIIDLSAYAAKKLGFYKKGFAKVCVRCLPKKSQIAALKYKRIPYPAKPPKQHEKNRP